MSLVCRREWTYRQKPKKSSISSRYVSCSGQVMEMIWDGECFTSDKSYFPILLPIKICFHFVRFVVNAPERCIVYRCRLLTPSFSSIDISSSCITQLLGKCQRIFFLSHLFFFILLIASPEIGLSASACDFLGYE